ncbi:MAG TPA: HD family phosphohydrolase [Treponema sp.]|nr:HD family phosphohydrolase [Treponema sp.]
MRKNQNFEIDYNVFDDLYNEICFTDKYLSMKEHIAHSDVSTYDHSVRVARECYKYAVTNEIDCDLKALVKAALLHDYYLYDWHKTPKFTFHGFKHALTAARNAEKDYGLTPKEKNIIESHMFPLNPLHLPRCKEAWILIRFDRRCSLAEIFAQKEKGTV